jgi:capsid protein
MPQRGVLLDHTGQPLQVNGHPRTELVRLLEARGRRAQLTYDAARDSDEFANYWAHADRLDADSANSFAVRHKLVSRSRYEAGSNAYFDGLIATCSNYVIGKTGPKLRLLSGVAGFNTAVETVWDGWAKAAQFRRKLWCMAHAKYGDGEGIGLVVTNQRLPHRVKLDLRLIETEQCSTPNLPYAADGYIDGIRFDELGNPVWFDILPAHPGAATQFLPLEPIRVPARFVLHWFQLSRPGQHRGVPEFKSSMNTGASSRRFREATVAAAETAADLALVVYSNLAPNSDDEADPVAPFSVVEFEKRMMNVMPHGWRGEQIKGEHPNSTYAEFLKSQLTETGRPKSVPHNLTACDSSDANFASGKLDREAFYAALDVDREDGNDTTLDPLFALWWAEAVREYGWQADPEEPPPHLWDWPQHPVADAVAAAQATDVKLRNGSTYPSQVYADRGEDFEDALVKMAADYGVSVDEMRRILLTATFNSQNQQASMQQAETQAQQAAAAPQEAASAA